MYKFTPLSGGSYIKLSTWVVNKKALINFKNNDERCFLYCYLRYIYPKENNKERIEKNLKVKCDELEK